MKAPDLSLGMTLGRAAAERAIIVAGVLIVLGAQSWWEDRALDEERRAVLELIRTDLVQIERALLQRAKPPVPSQVSMLAVEISGRKLRMSDPRSIHEGAVLWT